VAITACAAAFKEARFSMSTIDQNLKRDSSTERNSEERLSAAQQQLLEIEARVIHALGIARSILAATQQEHRELRNHADRTRFEIYTEREFAGLLKVSVSTIARLRKAGKIEHLSVGNQIRYSTTNLFNVVQTFSTAGQLRSRKH
jgi:hypothetical protein